MTGISKITEAAIAKGGKTLKRTINASKVWEELISRDKKPLYNDEMTALDRVLRKLDLSADDLQVQKMKTKNGYAIAHVKGDIWNGVVSIADLDKGGVVKFRGNASLKDVPDKKTEMSGFFDLSKKPGQKDTFIRTDKTGNGTFDFADGKAFKVHGSVSGHADNELPVTKAEANEVYKYIKEMRNKIAKALLKEVAESKAPAKSYVDKAIYEIAGKQKAPTKLQ